MNNFKDKVIHSEGFYQNFFLPFDYKLAEYNFETLKQYFKGSLALEMGPASGFMTRMLVDSFQQLHVVEGSKKLLDAIPDYPNLKKHHSFFEEFKPSHLFDTIIMSHVLEHLLNPVEVLSNVRNWLSEEGIFLISVPNAKSIHRLVAVEMGLLNNPFQLNQRDHDAGHYRVYDSELLKKDIQNAGFKILETGGIFLKPISNGQINEGWDDKMIEGFYKVGKHFPENCAEIYAICTK